MVSTRTRSKEVTTIPTPAQAAEIETFSNGTPSSPSDLSTTTVTTSKKRRLTKEPTSVPFPAWKRSAKNRVGSNKLDQNGDTFTPVPITPATAAVAKAVAALTTTTGKKVSAKTKKQSASKKTTTIAVDSVVSSENTGTTEEEELKEMIMESQHRAEEDGVLLHPPLSFSYEEAVQHLIEADKRWEFVIKGNPSLVCKPFQGEMTEEFNPFRSLSTSIIGQQVSWLAARSITHKFVRLFYPHLPEKLAPPGTPAPAPPPPPPSTSSLSSPPGTAGTPLDSQAPVSAAVPVPVPMLSPFPTPHQVVDLGGGNETERFTLLRSAGLSGRKVEYILELAQRFVDGRLSSRSLWEMTDEEVTKTLIEVRGIGIWTVHMFLIFSMKRSDILPVGDLGIQKNLCKWFSDSSLAPAINPLKLEVKKEVIEGEGLAPEAVIGDNVKFEESNEDIKVNGNREAEPKLTKKSKKGNTSIGVTGYMSSSKKGLAGQDNRKSTSQIFPKDEVEGEKEKLKVASSSPSSKFDDSYLSSLFPESISPNLNPAILRARLQSPGKKLKGNIYMTPKEMEEMTLSWKPYRSVACWFLWSLADGTGDP